MKSLSKIVAVLLLLPAVAFSHGKAGLPKEPDAERAIVFPDTPEFKTLVVDLHTHSVFSDGHVWPRTRVEEALRDGLDALAITEHLEWQPHRPDILHPDQNRAFEIASQAADGTGLLVIRGSEITRAMPVGHINAVFLTDANELLAESSSTSGVTDAAEYAQIARQWPARNALSAANTQGGFVFWNHPAWTSQATDGIARPSDFHLAAFARGELHGIEIANGDGYSEEAFQVALDNDLALIGVSDIHELIDWDYEPHNGGHRPVTLVFAEERTVPSIRDALFSRRTVVWYKNMLFGRAEHLMPLLEASLLAQNASYVGKTDTVELTLDNRSDARFILRNRSPYTFLDSGDLVEVPAHDSVNLTVKPRGRQETLSLTFEVSNALVRPKEAAEVIFTVPVEGAILESDP